MQTKFVVSHDGQELGPFSEDEIKQMLMINKLLPIDYLYDDSKQDWILLTERFDMKKLEGDSGLPRPKEPVKPIPANASAYPDLSEAPPPQDLVVRRAQATTTKSAEPKKTAPANDVAQTIAATNAGWPAASGISLKTASTSSAAPSNFGLATPSPSASVSINSTPSITLPGIPAVPSPAAQATSAVPGTPAVPALTAVSAPAAQATPAVPAVPTPTATPTPAFAIASQNDNSRIAFSSGVGIVSLTQLRAGKINLRLKDCSDKGLLLPAEMVVTIKSGPARQIRIKAPSSARAGEDLHLEFSAFDEYENAAQDFSGEMTLEWAGSYSDSRPVIFKEGAASLHFKPTKAESVTIQLSGGKASTLKMPDACKIEIKAGPAASLLIEAPKDVVAGQALPLTVKAVDAYGNLATDFKGELALGIAIEPASGKKAS